MAAMRQMLRYTECSLVENKILMLTFPVVMRAINKQVIIRKYVDK